MDTWSLGVQRAVKGPASRQPVVTLQPPSVTLHRGPRLTVFFHDFGRASARDRGAQFSTKPTHPMRYKCLHYTTIHCKLPLSFGQGHEIWGDGWGRYCPPASADWLFTTLDHLCPFYISLVLLPKSRHANMSLYPNGARSKCKHLCSLQPSGETIVLAPAPRLFPMRYQHPQRPATKQS